MDKHQFTAEELATEEWRTSERFPIYEVSSLGRVRSNQPRWNKPRIINGWSNSLGYLCVTIPTQTSKTLKIRIHRLVLEAFVGPCPVGMESRHKDGTRTNNRIDNLCWDTHYNNIQDQKTHGTFNLPVGWHDYHATRKPMKRRA